MKQKKQPMRKCSGCGEMKEKRELIRVVRSPEKTDDSGMVIQKAEISLDLTGKRPGRGAYLCKNTECLKKARKAGRFERSLRCMIPEEIYERLLDELADAAAEG